MTALMQMPAMTSSYSQIQPISQTVALGDEGLGSASPSSANDWVRCFDDLVAVGLLRDDWDGDGAKAPSPAVVSSARDLLQFLREMRLPAPSGIGAGPNGSVLVDWRNGRRYFEIDVIAPYTAEWLCREPGVSSRGGVIRRCIDSRLIRALARVMAG